MRQTLSQNTTAVLLQNATKVYYKMRQVFLLQNTTVWLQNATEIYYKMRQVFYYKMQQLLQIAMIL